MRRIILSCYTFLLSLLVATTVNAAVHEQYPYTFSISKHVYKFSEIYQITSRHRETYPGTVKKSSFRVRTNYDLSNADGWQATGTVRMISVGVLYPWAIDIDIYDTRGVQIGLIQGDFATFESAKYNLYEYDEAGNSSLIGIAYASNDFNQFNIFPSLTNPRPIAELHRNYHDNTWVVDVYNPEKIDDRMIRIFSGFVIDYENKFLR